MVGAFETDYERQEISVKASFIVPADALTANLLNLVCALSLLGRGRSETIVALDRSHLRDSEILLANAFPPEVTIAFSDSPAPQGPATARNRGAKLASAEVLVFVDSDVLFDAHGAALLVDRLVTDSSWHVGTVRLTGRHVNAYSDFFSYEALRVRNIGGRVFFPSAVFAIRSELFWAVGGFDESFPAAAGEDWDLLQKLHSYEPGLAVVRHVDIVAQHANPETFPALLARALRYGLHAHRYLTSSPLSKAPLRERVVDLLFSEVLIPWNRALTDVENLLRGTILPKRLRPLTNLKLAVIRAQRRLQNSVEPLTEDRQRFLLMERLWFRFRKTPAVPSVTIPVESTHTQLPHVTCYDRGVEQVTYIRPEKEFADTHLGQYSAFLRFALVTAWNLTHRFAVLLGFSWSRISSWGARPTTGVSPRELGSSLAKTPSPS